MDIFFGVLIIVLYMYGFNTIFKWIKKYIEKRTDDFAIQILPGWLIVSLTSLGIFLIADKDFTGLLFFKFSTYLSVGISVLLLIIIFFIKPLNPKLYHIIVAKIKK